VDGGRQLLDEAFEASGRSPEITLTLARELFRSNHIELARATYVKAALQFRMLGAVYRASEVLAELGHDLGKIKAYRHRSVIRILRWALQLSDRPARAHLRLGQFLETRGNLDEAIKCYQRATRLGPELAAGFYRLGALLVSTRAESSLAEQSLQRYLDLTRSPQGKGALNAQAWIARLQARRKFFATPPGR
jgi:tetratricopeptide (TPR) repeat protein